MALTTWDKFLDDCLTAQTRWNTNYNRPFGSAYERAEKRYLATLKAQEEADKAAAERKAMLLTLALSLVGGSVLSAVFAKAALKEVAGQLAKDAAMKVTVNRGWERAFNALAWTDRNATAKFVLGKLWDEAEGRVSNEVQAKLKALPKHAKLPSLQTADESDDDGRQPRGPLEVQNTLQTFSDNWFLSVKAAGRWAEPWGGQEALDRLRHSSPFFKFPRTPLFVDQTSVRIELALWMKYVLDLDYIETGRVYRPASNFAKPRTVPTSRTSIDVDPWSVKYPRRLKQPPGSNSSYITYAAVKYGRLGGVIKKRINKQHEKVMGKPLFTKAFEDYDKPSIGTLRIAHNTLQRLSMDNAMAIKAAIGK